MTKQANTDWSELTLLPEPMIQHIQSFLTGKEAALSSCMSKSWYEAWLTRPTLSFDEGDYGNGRFDEISTKTMERYRVMNLTIESFTLRTRTKERGFLGMEMTAAAIKLGATDLNIDVPNYVSNFVLPAEVLGSETLTRLSLRGVKDFGEGNVRCSRLKSLTLQEVCLKRDHEKNQIRDIFSCCGPCIEELSLCIYIYQHFKLKELYPFQLHKLRRLHLRCACIDESFFTGLAPRFPCLKDLSIDSCNEYTRTRLQIASTSLECISFVGAYTAMKAEFDVPNIRKFVYSGYGLPTLNFKPCSSEWESDISIKWNPCYKSSWFRRLKTLLTKLTRASSSRISLSVSPHRDWEKSLNTLELENKKKEIEYILDLEKKKIGVQNFVVVLENLTIHESSDSSTCWLLPGLFRICRPTFILDADNTLKEKITNLNLSTHLNMEFYDENLREWRPYQFLSTSVPPESIPKFRLHCTSV